MKVKNKILILVFGLSVLCMILIPNNVNAALQANGTTSKTDTIANWLLNIRKMEATGGTLGLTDTINTTSLVSSAEKSNNLDIHMEKNTEYGAMAILSASAYGNQNKITSGGTTTGNKTGVYINLNKEWVAAGSLLEVKAFTNANEKYKNVYTNVYAAKVGDAIGETTIGNVGTTAVAGWHGSTNNTWLTSVNFPGVIRAYSGSIFSYYGIGYSNAGDANYAFPWSSRAVIVVGQGF